MIDSMNIAQIETNLQDVIADFRKETFIFDLLLAYGTPKATIARLKQSEKGVFDESNNFLIIKKKLVFKEVESDDLQGVMNALKINEKVAKQSPRFIVVTNYETLLGYDTKTDESLDIPLLDIPRYYDFFLPWAGMEKAQQAIENQADVKAAERMAKLYDAILKDNPTTTHEEVHNLNVFLSRLLFCYFAEDTGIFEKNLFTKSIDSHTQHDGSDLNAYLNRLFEVMNTDYKERPENLPAFIAAFPYVNGGLFREHHTVPLFTRRSRNMLIECGALEWRDINPDIFGSMIQAVITPEHRGGLGMHYTSVPNIMKVIEPLFLDELKEEFANSKGNAKRLRALQQRISKIKIFDPACGSGNFLIIAYKELRKLEMDIFNELGAFAFSDINLENFYGIEIDDFAHEVATLSLWLAEHQMNQIFKEKFGDVKPALPLKETGNIVHANACRIEWETVCPKNDDDEIYILGNPPYLGARVQDSKQKEDLDFVFKGLTKYKDLDYIASWFYLGAKYIKRNNSKLAFVSTNSICQGDQVSLLWTHIFDFGLEIDFAHTSFKWTNNAKLKAAVIVIIVGIRNINISRKFLFNGKIRQQVNNINAYLVDSSNIIIHRRSNPISKLPKMPKGNMPYDGGHLILTTEEKNELIKKNPNSQMFIKKLVGAKEYINNIERWCLWITDDQLQYALQINEIRERINSVKLERINSNDDGAKKLAHRSHQFREINITRKESIIIPLTTSERRKYVPIGFIGADTIATNASSIIYDSDIYVFSVISSNIHMIWMRVIAGRLKSDYRYSSDLCYNNFPFPPIFDKQKKELEQHVYNILAEREKHSEKTLAELYDPDKMPEGLREAHRQNDLAVERCYRIKPFESDEERLEYLFKLYEQMIEEEKDKGTLFEGEKKGKKTKKTNG
jgi:hypothetical protein